MLAVARFSYGVEERLSALRDVLDARDLVPSRVRREWAYRAQLLLEPAGWNALWRLPRDSCRKAGVRFPCVVYVTVEELQLDDDRLCALVLVLGVQDDTVRLPERSLVPLHHLWPTVAQPEGAVDVRPTAEFIDLYRYFYTLIWMPWDLEEDERDAGGRWFERNVPARCHLWASAFSGHGLQPDVLYSLRDEGEFIRQHIAQIEDEIPSDNEDNFDTNAANVSTLASLHERLQALKARWEILQNPTLRHLWSSTFSEPSHTQSEITVVWTGGPLSDYIKCLETVNERLNFKESSHKKQVGCAPSLTLAFNPKPKPDSIVLLCEGSHVLPCNFTIGNNYTLSSISSKNTSTILKCTENCITTLTIVDSVEIRGLTIDTGYSNTGFAVRSGKLSMDSSIIIPSPKSQTQAAVIFGGAEISLNKCTVNGYFTGIVAHSGSKVELTDCILKNCGVMFQIFEGARVSLVRCTFENYSESAIRYESSKTECTKIGGADMLYSYGDITIKDCTFLSNAKNEVCITYLDEYACPQLEGEVCNI